MNYASLKFLLFVVALLIIYYVCPKKYRWVTLLIASLIFFYLFSGVLIIYCILASLVAYFASRLLIKNEKKKKLIFIISILVILGFLAVLKYNNFFISIINVFGLSIKYKKFLIPIGISYYTLEMISYMTDIYRKKYKPEKNFFKLLLFFTYFPKLVEGPISRYDKLSTTLFSENKFDYDNFRKAFVLIGYGFFKKLVIADRAGIFVDTFFSEGYTGLITVVAIVLYTIQIYADFSGCIDIVSGVSELFGVKLAENFRRPFFSTSIQEFWRRWHITLGEWLKDYIFYPISLSKMNMKLNLKVRKMKWKHLSRFITVAFPLFFVWFTNGLWHGASGKFVLYGLYYYVIMMLGVLFKPLLDKLVSLLKINTKVWSYKFFQIIRTIIIVCFGMFLFRCDTLHDFANLSTKMLSFGKFPLFSLGINKFDFVILAISVLILICIEIAQELGVNIREKLEEQNLVFRWIVYLIIIFGVIIFGIYGRGYSAKSFIYGGF